MLEESSSAAIGFVAGDQHRNMFGYLKCTEYCFLPLTGPDARNIRDDIAEWSERPHS